MGNTVGKILTAAVGVAVGVFAAPVAAALGGVVGAGSVAALGVGVALSGVSSLLRGTPDGEEEYDDPGQRLRKSVNTNLVREIAYGTVRTAGNLIFRDTTGTDNIYLHTVTLLAGHEIESVEAIEWGGDAVTFTSNSAKNGKWKQYEKLGGPSQVAETNLVAASTKWTSTHVGSGLAYIVNRFEYDPETEFQNGLQTVTYVFKGRKVYDPRLDSTNGGSGTHRINDETTYEWSNNAALCLLDYMIGHSEGGERIFGKFVNTAWIDWTSWVAAINICDESVTLDVGGSEARYTCDGFINTSNTHKQNIKHFLNCMAGEMMFQGGKWYLYAGAARTAVKTRNADHFIGSVSYEAKKDLSDKKNGVRGEFYDVSNGYQLQPYPTYQNSTYVTADGGQEQYLDISFPMTSSVTRAQRLAKIALGRARMERKVSGTTNLIGLQDRAGDVVTVDYPRLNLVSQEMKIMSWAMKVAKDKNGNKGLVVAQQYLEEDSTIYAWASSEEGTIAPPGTLNHPDKTLLDWGYIRGDAKPADYVTNEGSTAHGGSLITNSDMTMVASDGRPAGVIACHGGTDGAVISYYDAEKTILQIGHATGDASTGGCFPAYRVVEGRTYKVNVRARCVDGNKASGFYIYATFHGNELGTGITHVCTNGTFEVGGVDGDISTTTLRNNGAITTSWVDYEYTFTVPSGALWSSVQVLNWTDMGNDLLLIDRATSIPTLIDSDSLASNAVTKKTYHEPGNVTCTGGGSWTQCGSNMTHGPPVAGVDVYANITFRAHHDGSASKQIAGIKLGTTGVGITPVNDFIVEEAVSGGGQFFSIRWKMSTTNTTYELNFKAFGADDLVITGATVEIEEIYR